MKDIKVIDIVKNNVAKFEYATSGVLHYKIETDTHVYIFPVDMNDKEDVGTTRFESEYKAITLMRYVNKSIKNETLAFYEKKKTA
jgi:hypothetical protein